MGVIIFILQVRELVFNKIKWPSYKIVETGTEIP